MDLTVVTDHLASEVRTLAHRAEGARAETVRHRSRVTRAALLDWQSPAGSAYMASVGAEVAALSRLADGCGDLAQALHLLAAALERGDGLGTALLRAGVPAAVESIDLARRALRYHPGMA